MMWVRCAVLALGCCMALRTNGPSAVMKKNTVELVLSLSDPEAEAGKPIEFAVDGARQLSKTHATLLGKPVVFHHIAKGSVVTAHVGTRGACAYWVTPGVKHCTVGEWEVSLTTIEENEEGIGSEASYETYVQVVGWGSLVRVDVDGVEIKTFDSVAECETFRHSGLKKGDLVRAISDATGDTCSYRVGTNAEVRCHLDNTWGLLMGSIREFDEDHANEGVISTEIKKYTVDFALDRDDAAAKKLDITLNGHLIASKMNATEVGKSIIVHHVKGGSVLTAVAHDNQTACCIYVGAVTGMQPVTCAGWTLSVQIREETTTSFENDELFDVGFSVHRGSETTIGTWGLEANDQLQVISNLPKLFPGSMGTWSRGIKVIPTHDLEPSTDCAHVVGENETTCEYNDWKFQIWSKLNMNPKWNGDNWDWDDSDTDIADSEMFEVKVTAIDTSDTSQEVTLECIAHQKLDFVTVPFGGTEKHIRRGEHVFKTKILTVPNPETVVKSAEFVGYLEAGFYLQDGFACTVYKEESIMCEANTDGGSWTYNENFSLEIHLGNSP